MGTWSTGEHASPRLSASFMNATRYMAGCSLEWMTVKDSRFWKENKCWNPQHLDPEELFHNVLLAVHAKMCCPSQMTSLAELRLTTDPGGARACHGLVVDVAEPHHRL